MPRVDTAINCVFYVNPDISSLRIEGAAVDGDYITKYGEITLKNGRVEQDLDSNDYPDYPARTRNRRP